MRWDARTARKFIGSLPNELPPGELIRIVQNFIERNFTPYGLCAIAAIDRNRLDIRVSHESLEIQGRYDREPTIHLSRIDWQREMRGERTPAGDKKRAIAARNREQSHNRQLE